MVTVFSNGLYVTLNNGLVITPVAVAPVPVELAELVPLPAA